MAVAALVASCSDGGPGASDRAADSDRATTTTPGTAGSAGSATTTTATRAAPLDLDLEPGDFETIATGLAVPWAVAFAGDDTLLVTERPGRVRLIRNGRLQPQPVAVLDVVAEGEGGLLGIDLHPDFPRQRFAYLYYTASDTNRVSRFSVGDDFTFGDEEVLLDGIPAARFHDGGRVHFGPDRLLYISTGDARQPELAARPGSLAGKILRLTADGAVPPGGPFPGSPVYTFGHRNPQGFDWDDDGNLYASEHGPTGELGLCCHDEVNLIRAGQFYGWPFVAGRVPAAAGSPPQEPVAPIAASGDETWAPAGLAAVDRPDGTTSLLVANLAARQVLRLDVAADDPARVVGTAVALEGIGRVRVAALGPDGCLYLTTSNTDGRGDPRPDDDRVLRTCP